MANLVRITDITLSTTTQKGDQVTADCEAVKILLLKNNIPFKELWYNDPKIDEVATELQGLSTWVWGINGVRGTRVMTQMPILRWTYRFDDFSVAFDHAMGLQEITSCIDQLRQMKHLMPV